MSRIADKVTRLAAPECAELGFELVDVEYVKEGKDMVLRLFVDKPGGITADDCADLSRRLDPLLDEADPIAGSYYLQVSSPGLDRPLTREADFHRFAGSHVRLRTYTPINGRRNFQGLLRGWRDDHVILELDGEQMLIPFEQITRARLDPQI